MEKNSFNSFVTKKLPLLKLKNSNDFSFSLLLLLKNSFSYKFKSLLKLKNSYGLVTTCYCY